MINPLVSVVIPCFNAKSLLDGCLKSVLKTTYKNYEVIIIDDYSTDGSFEILQKKYSKYPKFKIIRNEKNMGPSYTRNNGYKNSKGKYVAFIETDMEVDPSWLEPLVLEMEKDPKLGAVQSRTLDINRRDRMHSLGVKFNPHTFWVISPGCGSLKDWVPLDPNMGIGSVGSMMRKSVLDKIGAYDYKIVHNIDDLDLGWRIWLTGYYIKPVYNSITYHWTGKPLSIRAKTTPSAASEFHFHKNLRLFLKNYEWKNIIYYTPWLFLAFSLRAFKNLFQGNPKPLLAFLKSMVWNLQVIEDTLSERGRIQKLRKRTDKEMFDLLSYKVSFFEFHNKYIVPNLMRVKQVFQDLDKSDEFCFICREVILNDKSFKIRSWGKYKYKICSFCNYGVLSPIPTKKNLEKIYSKGKYFTNLSAPVKNNFVQWIIIRGFYKSPANWVNQSFKKGKILDVGCGNGEFLDNLKQSFWEVWGIDISKEAAKRTGEKIGKEKAKSGEFLDQKYITKFNYISFWHILEHIKNPLDYLRHASKLLDNKGKVVGEVPNFNSPILRLFKENYSWYMLPDHIGYFSPKALTRVLEAAGFKDIKIFSPHRSLLNFALSFKKYLESKKIASNLVFLIFLFLIPVSVILGLFFSLINKGEVLRFEATKV